MLVLVTTPSTLRINTTVTAVSLPLDITGVCHLFEHYARTRSIKTPSYTQVTSGIYTHARFRWLRYEKQLKPHIDRLRPFIHVFGYS